MGDSLNDIILKIQIQKGNSAADIKSVITEITNAAKQANTEVIKQELEGVKTVKAEKIKASSEEKEAKKRDAREVRQIESDIIDELKRASKKAIEEKSQADKDAAAFKKLQVQQAVREEREDRKRLMEDLKSLDKQDSEELKIRQKMNDLEVAYQKRKLKLEESSKEATEADNLKIKQKLNDLEVAYQKNQLKAKARAEELALAEELKIKNFNNNLEIAYQKKQLREKERAEELALAEELKIKNFNNNLEIAYQKKQLREKERAEEKQAKDEAKNDEIRNLTNTLQSGTAALGAFYAALKLISTDNAFIQTSSQYEVNLRNFNAVALQTEEQLRKTHEEFKDIATDEQLSGMTKLAEALRIIQTAGFEGADGLTVLSAANRGAQADLSDLSKTAALTTSVLNTYSQSAEHAAEVININSKAIKLGKLTQDELNSSMGTAISLSAEAGVEYAQVAAAMATIHKQGVSAHISATEINAVLKAAFHSGADSIAFARSLGIELSSAAIQLKGVGGFVKDIFDKTAKFGADQQSAIARLIPDIRSLRGLEKLVNDEGKTFNDILAEMKNGVDQTSLALEQQTKTFQYQRQALGDLTEALKIEFGELLQDAIKPFIQNLNLIINLFLKLPEPIRVIIESVALLATGIISLATAIGGLTLALNLMQDSLILSATATKGLEVALISLGGIGLGMLAAGGFFYAIHEWAVHSKNEFLEIVDLMGKMKNYVDSKTSEKNMDENLQNLEEIKQETLHGLALRNKKNRTIEEDKELILALRNSANNNTSTKTYDEKYDQIVRESQKNLSYNKPFGMDRLFDDDFATKQQMEADLQLLNKQEQAKRSIIKSSVTGKPVTVADEEKLIAEVNKKKLNAEADLLQKQLQLRINKEEKETKITLEAFNEQDKLAKKFVSEHKQNMQYIIDANNNARQSAIYRANTEIDEIKAGAKAYLIQKTGIDPSTGKKVKDPENDRDRDPEKEKEAADLFVKIEVTRQNKLAEIKKEYDEKDRRAAVTLANDKIESIKKSTQTEINSIDAKIQKIHEEADKKGMSLKQETFLINGQLAVKQGAYLNEAKQIQAVKSTIKEVQETRKKEASEAIELASAVAHKITDNNEKVRAEEDKNKKDDEIAFDKVIKETDAKIIKSVHEQKKARKEQHEVNLSIIQTESKELVNQYKMGKISEDEYFEESQKNLKKQSLEYKRYGSELSGIDKDRTIAINKSSDLNTEIILNNYLRIKNSAKDIADPILNSFEKILPGVTKIFDMIIDKNEDFQKTIVKTASSFASAIGFNVPGSQAPVNHSGSNTGPTHHPVSTGGQQLNPLINDKDLQGMLIAAQSVIKAVEGIATAFEKVFSGEVKTAEEFVKMADEVGNSMPGILGLLSQLGNMPMKIMIANHKKNEEIKQAEYELNKTILESQAKTTQSKLEIEDNSYQNSLRLLKEQESNEQLFALKSEKLLKESEDKKTQILKSALEERLNINLSFLNQENDLKSEFLKSSLSFEADSAAKSKTLIEQDKQQKDQAAKDELYSKLRDDKMSQEDRLRAWDIYYSKLFINNVESNRAIQLSNEQFLEKDLDLQYEYDKAVIDSKEDSLDKTKKLIELEKDHTLAILRAKYNAGLILLDEYNIRVEIANLKAISDNVQANVNYGDKIRDLNQKNYDLLLKIITSESKKRIDTLKSEIQKEIDLIENKAKRIKEIEEGRTLDEEAKKKRLAQFNRDIANAINQKGADFYRANPLDFDTGDGSTIGNETKRKNTIDAFDLGNISYDQMRQQRQQEAIDKYLYYLNLTNRLEDPVEKQQAHDKAMAGQREYYEFIFDAQKEQVETEAQQAAKKLPDLKKQLAAEEKEYDKLVKSLDDKFRDSSGLMKDTYVSDFRSFIDNIQPDISKLGVDLYTALREAMVKFKENDLAYDKLVQGSNSSTSGSSSSSSGGPKIPIPIGGGQVIYLDPADLGIKTHASDFNQPSFSTSRSSSTPTRSKTESYKSSTGYQDAAGNWYSADGTKLTNYGGGTPDTGEKGGVVGVHPHEMIVPDVKNAVDVFKILTSPPEKIRGMVTPKEVAGSNVSNSKSAYYDCRTYYVSGVTAAQEFKDMLRHHDSEQKVRIWKEKNGR